MNIIFVLTNSVDPDEMPHYAAFHQGLHYLLKYPFKGFSGLNKPPDDSALFKMYFLISNQNICCGF